jgi:hypothetical protein
MNQRCNPMATHRGGTITGRVNMTDIRSFPLKSYNPRALPAGMPIATDIRAVTRATSILWTSAVII